MMGPRPDVYALGRSAKNSDSALLGVLYPDDTVPSLSVNKSFSLVAVSAGEGGAPMAGEISVMVCQGFAGDVVVRFGLHGYS